jgi:hypothetical protein
MSAGRRSASVTKALEALAAFPGGLEWALVEADRSFAGVPR